MKLKAKYLLKRQIRCIDNAQFPETFQNFQLKGEQALPHSLFMVRRLAHLATLYFCSVI